VVVVEQAQDVEQCRKNCSRLLEYHRYFDAVQSKAILDFSATASGSIGDGIADFSLEVPDTETAIS